MCGNQIDLCVSAIPHVGWGWVVYTVVATEGAGGFVIEKSQLEALMRSDAEIKMKVLENIAALLSERVIGANAQIEYYAKKSREK